LHNPFLSNIVTYYKSACVTADRKFLISQTISIIEFKLKPYFVFLTLIENCSTNKKTLLPY